MANAPFDPNSDIFQCRYIQQGAALTVDSTKPEALRRILVDSHGDRRSFLLRALSLGISIPAAYAAIGLTGGSDRAEAAMPTSADLDALDRRLAAYPSGKVVAPKEPSGDSSISGGVKARVEGLRQTYAKERQAATSGSAPTESSRRPDMQLSQDEWNNWNNWDNWNNWENWQDWNNWGNGGD